MKTSIEIFLLPLALLSTIPVVYLLLNSYLSRKRRPAGVGVEVPIGDVTIIVPVYRTDPRDFQESLASVAQQGCPFVVVGDGCVEPYRGITEELNGRFIALDHHGGKKAALAAGIDTVRTPYVLLVDSDSVLPPRAAQDLAAHFSPGVGGVGANLSVKDTGHPVAYCAEFVERAREVVLRAMSSQGSVLYLDGACAMFKTEVVRPFVRSSDFQQLRVFGQPSSLGDDWQLTDFILREGLTTAKAYDVHVVTSPKHTFSQFVQQNVRWSRSNWIRFGRFLTGRGPSGRGTFFTFEVVATYALPLVALATLLARVPLILHLLAGAPLTLEGVGEVLLRSLIGIPHNVSEAVTRLSLTLAGAFATGVYVGTVARSTHHPTLRMVTYGAVGTVVLFTAAVFGLVTFWKRPSWGGWADARPGEAPAPLSSPTEAG
jgi:cellulose synthase/poly-beta-1,6-N-acetylglucosamine synthase-like glycosyltransferase